MDRAYLLRFPSTSMLKIFMLILTFCWKCTIQHLKICVWKWLSSPLFILLSRLISFPILGDWPVGMSFIERVECIMHGIIFNVSKRNIVWTLFGKCMTQSIASCCLRLVSTIMVAIACWHHRGSQRMPQKWKVQLRKLLRGIWKKSSRSTHH